MIKHNKPGHINEPLLRFDGYVDSKALTQMHQILRVYRCFENEVGASELYLWRYEKIFSTYEIMMSTFLSASANVTFETLSKFYNKKKGSILLIAVYKSNISSLISISVGTKILNQSSNDLKIY